MATAKRLFSPPKSGKAIRRDKESGRFFDASSRDDARFSDASSRDDDRRDARNGGTSIYHPSQGSGMGARAGYVQLISAKAARSVAKPTAAPKRRDTHFYPKEIFSSQAEYDASVDSVVARIKSGEVKARTPDE
ncbi:MAG: hypothetical protein ACRYFX_10820 [Janthinobacterium lividum]